MTIFGVMRPKLIAKMRITAREIVVHGVVGDLRGLVVADDGHSAVTSERSTYDRGALLVFRNR